MLRQVTKHANRVLPSCRLLSSAPAPLVDVTDHDGIAVVTLQRPPVNSLSLELLQALSKSLTEVENNKPRGMILTSALPTVFSAGLDITELIQPEKNRVELFWSTLQETWLKLFGFKYATAAAINGHSPAGGCVFATSCEWRAMVGGDGKYTIGLNESALGVAVTQWIIDTMCHTIRKRNAEIALTAGELYTADEALKIGLIDEIVTDKADAIEKCKIFIQKFDKIPPVARTVSKLRIRQEPLRRLQENRKKDVDDFVQPLFDPEVQKYLKNYVQSLKKKQQ